MSATYYTNWQQDYQQRNAYFLNSCPNQTAGTVHYYPRELRPNTQQKTVTAQRKDCQVPSYYDAQQTAAVLQSGSSSRDSLILTESIDEDSLTRLCYAMGLDKLYYLPDLNHFTDVLEGM
jgi:hypothetical protein